VIAAMHREAPEVRLIAKSNAGIPQWKNNELLYDATPSIMGRHAQRVRALGASFIGGCCGNGPDHIAAIADALREPISASELASLQAERDLSASQPEETAGRERTRRRTRD